MSAFCQNCGKEIKDINSKFCINCGAEIERISEKVIIEEKKKKEKYNKGNKTFLNMEPNTEALIMYIIPVLGLIAILTKDREYNEFSIFHYKQTACLFIVSVGLTMFYNIFHFIIPTIIIIGITLIVLSIFQIGAAIRAYQNQKFEIPIIYNLSQSLFK